MSHTTPPQWQLNSSMNIWGHVQIRVFEELVQNPLFQHDLLDDLLDLPCHSLLIPQSRLTRPSVTDLVILSCQHLLRSKLLRMGSHLIHLWVFGLGNMVAIL